MQKNKLGVSTKAFGGKSVEETAQLFAKANLCCTELCFCLSDLSGWQHNLGIYRELPDAEEVQKAIEIFKSYGVEVCAIGVYSNLWDGDAGRTLDSHKLFCEYCNLAYLNNVKTLTTFGGNTLIRAMRNGLDEIFYRKVYEAFGQALAEAKKRGITIALDISCGDVITDYKAYTVLKNYITDEFAYFDNLRLIYDIESASENVSFDEIALCHIKDKKKNGVYFERYGTGDGDFSKIYKIAKERPDIPLIFEYVNSENVTVTVADFRENLEKYR